MTQVSVRICGALSNPISLSSIPEINTSSIASGRKYGVTVAGSDSLKFESAAHVRSAVDHGATYRCP